MLRASRPTLWQIARREALDHLSSLRFYVIVATMAVLVGVSTFVMYRDYSLRMANHAVLRERARPRPGESGVMAVVEPRPLSVFAKGLDEVMGRGYTVTAYVGIDVHDRQTQRESLFSLVPQPDLLYVVKTLVSLVALLFAFDAMSGEKERGTLKLTLSFAVSRGQLVAGKLAAGLAAVLAPLGVAWLAALLVLSLQPDLVLGRGVIGAPDNAVSVGPGIEFSCGCRRQNHLQDYGEDAQQSTGLGRGHGWSPLRGVATPRGGQCSRQQVSRKDRASGTR